MDGTKFCYECGGTMLLVKNNKRESWQCKCGHVLPVNVHDKHIIGNGRNATINVPLGFTLIK